MTDERPALFVLPRVGGPLTDQQGPKGTFMPADTPTVPRPPRQPIRDLYWPPARNYIKERTRDVRQFIDLIVEDEGRIPTAGELVQYTATVIELAEHLRGLATTDGFMELFRTWVEQDGQTSFTVLPHPDPAFRDLDEYARIVWQGRTA